MQLKCENMGLEKGSQVYYFNQSKLIFGNNYSITGLKIINQTRYLNNSAKSEKIMIAFD